jgi:hypothetical protein
MALRREIVTKIALAILLFSGAVVSNAAPRMTLDPAYQKKQDQVHLDQLAEEQRERQRAMNLLRQRQASSTVRTPQARHPGGARRGMRRPLP